MIRASGGAALMLSRALASRYLARYGFQQVALGLGVALERAQLHVLLIARRDELLHRVEACRQRYQSVAGELGVVVELARQPLALNLYLSIGFADLRAQFLDARMLVHQRGRLLGKLRAQDHALLDQPAHGVGIGDV